MERGTSSAKSTLDANFLPLNNSKCTPLQMFTHFNESTKVHNTAHVKLGKWWYHAEHNLTIKCVSVSGHLKEKDSWIDIHLLNDCGVFVYGQRQPNYKLRNVFIEDQFKTFGPF